MDIKVRSWKIGPSRLNYCAQKNPYSYINALSLPNYFINPYFSKNNCLKKYLSKRHDFGDSIFFGKYDESVGEN